MFATINWPLDCIVIILYQHDCEYDSVEVKGGLGEEAMNHGVFCGTKKPLPITSEGNTLLVEFTSDGTVQRTGFEAYFFTGRAVM